MKWTRAIQHLRNLADECARMHGLPRELRTLPVVQLWTFGRVLDERTDLDWAQVALSVDEPEVPWLSRPDGATWWSNSTRLSKNPLTGLWRSSHAPVWNHHIVRPVLLWDAENGIAEDSFDAIRHDDVDRVRIPAPSPEELRERLDAELVVSLKAMREAVKVYEDTRWSPRKLEPVADDLHAVTNGYLDILDARR